MLTLLHLPHLISLSAALLVLFHVLLFALRRLGVCLLPFVPPAAAIVRTATERHRRLGCGATLLWCTLASMTGALVADPIARALASVAAAAGPVTHTADVMHRGELLRPIFRVGATPMASMAGMRPVSYDPQSVGYALQRDAAHQLLLRRELELSVGAGELLLSEWAERIRPPPQELLDWVQVRLPDMLAEDLLHLPYSPVYVPPATSYLPRMPAQLPAPTPFCVRSAMQLLEEPARWRVHTWLSKVLDQLRCIEEHPREHTGCELLRPQPLALGQEAMLPWARGRVWDLTFERAACAVPLDTTLPLDTHLNLPFLRKRLEGYPDQNLISNILEGVRFAPDLRLCAGTKREPPFSVKRWPSGAPNRASTSYTCTPTTPSWGSSVCTAPSAC